MKTNFEVIHKGFREYIQGKITIQQLYAKFNDLKKELQEIADKHEHKRKDGSIQFHDLVNLTAFIREEILGT